MNEQKTISLIIPFYNTEAHVFDKCLESVLAQKYRDYEILIVDDGSRQEFLPYLEDCRRKSSKVHVLKKRNGGPSSARNYGIHNAAGKFIMFLDSDDELLPGTFQKAVKEISENDCDIVIGGVVRDKRKWKPQKKYKKVFYKKTDNEISNLKKMMVIPGDYSNFTGGYINRGPVARLVKTSLAKQVPFDEEVKIGEDILWNIMLLKLADKIEVCYDAWYYYKQNDKSISNKYDPQIEDKIKVQLVKLGRQLNLSDNVQYTAYIDHIYESILQIWRSWLGHKKCNLSFCLKNREINHIYSTYPWLLLGEHRFIKLASPKKKIQAVLYKRRLLFLFFRVVHP